MTYCGLKFKQTLRYAVSKSYPSFEQFRPEMPTEIIRDDPKGDDILARMLKKILKVKINSIEENKNIGQKDVNAVHQSNGSTNPSNGRRVR